MKVNKIAVNYGRTVNMGNYESFRIDLTAEAELTPSDVGSQIDQKFTELRDWLRIQTVRMIKEEGEFIRDERKTPANPPPYMAGADKPKIRR